MLCEDVFERARMPCLHGLQVVTHRFEKAHERPAGEDWVCRNRRFADFPDTSANGFRAFDLRVGLSPE